VLLEGASVSVKKQATPKSFERKGRARS